MCSPQSMTSLRTLGGGKTPALTPEWIADANKAVLRDLGPHLDEGVVPGEVSRGSVVVGRYRGAPREDCSLLLHRLCRWIEGDDLWPSISRYLRNRMGDAILRAALAHLYILWIHPFGDGNGRTARLVEFMILARAGVPDACAHLLSNHYNTTRTEYYRQLDRSSRANSGQGDVMGFVEYSLAGLVDGLEEQCKRVEASHLQLAWEHYVYEQFRTGLRSEARDRRRELTLTLGQLDESVPRRQIPDLTPSLARLYATKTTKTLTRDLNWLVDRGLLHRSPSGFRAPTWIMRAFQPATASSAP